MEKGKQKNMEIIPAIDLLEGSCVRLNQGNYSKVTRFSKDPVTQALEWEQQGATRLHLVDLDGAKTGLPVNDAIIRSITNSIKIPIQVGGGIRSIERAEALIECGVSQIILGTVAIEKPELVNELINRYPRKVIIGIDSNQGKVATRGWIEQSEIDATDLAKSFSRKEISGIITTDIARDGTLEGPNIEAMKNVASVSDVPVIASGGVGCLADLISLIPLESNGVTGVIVGRALYDGRVNLEEAIKIMAQSQLKDSHPHNNFYV